MISNLVVIFWNSEKIEIGNKRTGNEEIVLALSYYDITTEVIKILTIVLFLKLDRKAK